MRWCRCFPSSEGFSIQRVNALHSGRCCVGISPLVSLQRVCPEHTVVLRP